jgi:acyl carrier protein
VPDMDTSNGARGNGARPAGFPYDEAEAFAIVTEIISAVGGIEQAELIPARRVGELGIDSILAGEIIAQAEHALDIDIDIWRVSGDWSGLTLRELVAEFLSGSATAG